MTTEIEKSWAEFLDALGPEDELIEKQIKHDVLELFDTQSNVDRAKKNLFKPELGKLFRLYFSRVDINALHDNIRVKRQNFIRGLGRDKFNHLHLLIRLKIIEDAKKPKRGLLAV